MRLEKCDTNNTLGKSETRNHDLNNSCHIKKISNFKNYGDNHDNFSKDRHDLEDNDELKISPNTINLNLVPWDQTLVFNSKTSLGFEKVFLIG